MNSDLKDILLKILGIVMASLLAFSLIGVYYYDKQETREQFEKWSEYETATADMRAEVSGLSEQIRELSKPIAYFGEESRYMIAFSVESKADISYIAGLAKAHKFSPIIIIDDKMDSSKIVEIVKATDKSWEFMLQMTSMSDRSVAHIATVKSILKDLKREDCGVVFCRTEGVKSDELEIIKSSGFKGYTVFEESPTSGQIADGTVYFNYYRIGGDDAVIDSKLAESYLKKASMVFVFDLLRRSEGVLSDEKIETLLGYITETVTKDVARLSTAADTVESLSGTNDKIAELKKSNEDEIKQLEARIAELNAIMKSMEPKS